MLATDANARPLLDQSQLLPSKSRKRFTLDGEDSLEARLASACEAAAKELQQIVPSQKLEAMLLGGGYGRGEGGVLKTPDGDHPYNDLEFYIFISGNRFLNRRRFTPALNQLAHKLTQVVGIEVEFHIISSAQLRKSKPSMFYYDLVAGHQQLCGDAKVLQGNDHHRDPKKLPLAEATRLLMNRGTGLLLAREKLFSGHLSTDDRDFIARNIAKAQLALGDAVLTVCGLYHWSCCERNRRLSTLDHAVTQQPWFDLVCRHHGSGIEFKLHPHQSDASAAELRERHDSIAELMQQVWLWIESLRLQKNFTSTRQYATSAVDKCPETNPWRNRLLNTWIFGPGILRSSCCRRHPRERVLNALSILLWDEKNSAEHLRDLLRADSTLLDAYKRIWERVR